VEGWSLIHAGTAKQDPFREGGRQDNGKWRPVAVTGAKRGKESSTSCSTRAGAFLGPSALSPGVRGGPDSNEVGSTSLVQGDVRQDLERYRVSV
jgi:hypothetical protein